MTNKEIMEDLVYRQNKFDIIRQLEEEVKDGIHDDNPLIELVLFYKREIEQLEEENKRIHEELNPKSAN